MSLPQEIRGEIASAVGRIEAVRSVGGGCIGSAFRLTTDRGDRFLKLQRDAPAGFFAAEAAGLVALAGAGTSLRIPEVIACRDVEGAGWSWILLEWLDPRPAAVDFAVRLGEGLAELHARSAPSWGWERDGYIGTLKQRNECRSDWPRFWTEERLLPQLEWARDVADLGPAADWERLIEALPVLLAPAEEEGPSLLHGDLWSGNVFPATGGLPALVDPACYRGHREVDLAMSALFGGFDSAFYDAYSEAAPFAEGHEIRRLVYQLYYLLVHVNLFGGSYAPGTRRTLREVVAAL